MSEYPYIEPYPMGGTDGEPEPRDKVMLQHAGYHKLVRGVMYNPSCLACQEEGHNEAMGITKCPTGLGKIHCSSCAFNKEGLCDYPYGKRLSKIDFHLSPLGEELAEITADRIWGQPLSYVPLETLARIRDDKLNEFLRVFTQLQIISSMRPT